MLYGISYGTLSPLLDAAASALGERYGLELAPFRYESEKFKRLREEGMSPTASPSSAQSKGAQLLSDSVVRQGALAIATSGGGLLTRDLAKQLPPSEQARAGDVKDALETAGLVTAELVSWS